MPKWLIARPAGFRGTALWAVTELPTRAITPLCVARLLARLLLWPSQPASALDAWAAVEVAFFLLYTLRKAHLSRQPAQIPTFALDRQPAEPSKLLGIVTFLELLAEAIGPGGDRAVEVAEWFMYKGGEARSPAWAELRAGNLGEWLAWAYWNADPAQVPATELEPLVGAVERWVREGAAELPALPPGYNAALFACRLTLDGLRCSHRPLFAYVVTHLACAAAAYASLRSRGFVRRRAGSLSFWHKPGAGASTDPRPLVFLGGLGVGLVSYLRLIDELEHHFPGRALLLVELEHLCMRLPLQHVPSPQDSVNALRHALELCGAEGAHFICHSFGTVVLSWLLRLAPEGCVQAATFVDPIPFLLFKSNVALVRYFVAEELGISLSLHRHFSWGHNVLHPRLLARTPASVVLSEFDAYVPSAAVARHLAEQAPHVCVSTLHGHAHSGFCFSSGGPRAVAEAAVRADKEAAARRRKAE
ncbi:hypothetical protein T492DRAFT_1148551 [Pavlovales sp. CCMP2436]|nr:hypothetical protein T492DRAFT_1148551 [Pavlovales sp. CCMP2436]